MYDLTTPDATRPPRRGGLRAAVSVAAILLVFATACGGGDTDTIEDSASAVSIGDEDDTVVEETDVDEPADEPEPDPTDAPEPTAVPTDIPEPTAVPEPTQVPEPTEEPTEEPTDGALTEAEQLAALDRAAEAFDEEIGACLISTIAVDNPELLRQLLVTDNLSALPFDDQAAIAGAALDCDPEGITELFNAAGAIGSEDGLPESFGPCLTEQLRQSPAALVGVIALGEEVPIPPEAQDPLIDTMTTCINGEVFSDMMVAEFNADPELAGLLDEPCLRAAFNDETTRNLWTIFITDPNVDFDNSPEIEAILGAPLINCISLGAAFKAQAALDGWELSDSSADCLDDTLRESGALDALAQGGQPDEAVLGGAIFSCLTPDEIVSIAGS